MTKVIFRLPFQLTGLVHKAIVGIFNGQNSALKVSDWRILLANKDQKGPLKVSVVDDSTLEVIQASRHRAHIGLWRIPLLTSGGMEV